MTRVGGLAAAGVLLVSAALAGGVTSASPQQFRAGVDAVHLPVTVSGKGHALVRGLSVSDFEVLEDGQPQKVTLFAEGASGEALPLHLGLLLDTSGSMEGDLSAAQNAAVQFINALHEAVDVTFVDFSDKVSVSRFSPASYPQLFERIRRNKADGYTALYDALAMYLSGAAEQDGQKVLLVYSDGGDSRSSTSYSKLREMLRLSDVLVFAVGYLENQGSSARGELQMRLTQIARETGGDAFFPAGRDDIHTIYARILDDIFSRYTLGFVSSNTKADGKWRKLEVRVKSPAGSKVRARPGYFAPLRVGGR